MNIQREDILIEDKIESTNIAEKRSLEEIISKDSENCRTNEEVEIFLGKIKTEINNKKFSSEISSVFDFQFNFSKHDEFDNLISEKVIGNWLSKNENEFFAEARIEEESYKEEVSDFFNYGLFNRGTKIITKYRDIIVGYTNTSNVSFDIIRIDANSKFPNVLSYNCTISIILSKRSIVFFYFYNQYQEKNWNQRELLPNIKWSYFENFFIDEKKTIDSLNSILDEYGIFILNNLKERFKLNSS